MKRLVASVAAALCIVFIASLGAVEVWTVARDVRTADHNGDGRPDVWRYFDARGQLTEVDVDTNFDGQPDVEEYYQRGALVRRESDRNFNGQADLIEEFDAVTHGQTRAVIDIDYDGAADLLVLFRDGRPVFTERAQAGHPATTAGWMTHAGVAGHLAPLADPFDSETAVRTRDVAVDEVDCVGLATCGSVPAPEFALVDVLSTSGAIRIAGTFVRSTAAHHARSPRAPPAA